MRTYPAIASVQLRSLRVSAKSEWLFLEVRCEDGTCGVGEATMEGHEAAVRAAIADLAGQVVGTCIAPGPVTGPLARFAAGNPARYTAISALEQALWDARGRRLGRCVADLLGARTEAPRLYANINRSIEDRSPEGFAAKAAAAVGAGFGAVKIAPFDGLNWTAGHDGGQEPLYAAGLARIAATRGAIGPEVSLMVDCHWRFDPATAERLIGDVAPFGLYWLECPVPERPASIPAVAALRGLCAARGMLLAGLESLNGLGAFLPWLEAGALDVIMPDVKYAGGLGECRLIARAAELHGVICSPHNPTGPVCHAASLHLAAGLANCPILEHQYDETPLFHEIAGGAFPALRGGRAGLPEGPGLGIELALPASAELFDPLGRALQH